MCLACVCFPPIRYFDDVCLMQRGGVFIMCHSGIKKPAVVESSAARVCFTGVCGVSIITQRESTSPSVLNAVAH